MYQPGVMTGSPQWGLVRRITALRSCGCPCLLSVTLWVPLHSTYPLARALALPVRRYQPPQYLYISSKFWTQKLHGLVLSARCLMYGFAPREAGFLVWGYLALCCLWSKAELLILILTPGYPSQSLEVQWQAKQILLTFPSVGIWWWRHTLIILLNKHVIPHYSPDNGKNAGLWNRLTEMPFPRKRY